MKAHGELSMGLQDRIRELIVSGSFLPGERLKEESLAKRFRVSRTPLRQALLGIKAEGLLQSRPNIGFVVAPLCTDEVSSLYPIVWTLEALAVEQAFPLVRSSLKKLEQANQSFWKSRRDPAGAQRWDETFHELLIGLSTNERLKEIIRGEKRKLCRYERFYMQDSRQIADSVRDHEQLLEAIEMRDLAASLEALVENWRHDMWAILGRMRTGTEEG